MISNMASNMISKMARFTKAVWRFIWDSWPMLIISMLGWLGVIYAL